MKTFTRKAKEQRPRSAAHSNTQKPVAKSAQLLSDNQPDGIAQRRLSNDIDQAKISNDVHTAQLVQPAIQLQSIIQRYDKTDFNKIKNLVASYSQNKALIDNVGDASAFNQKLNAMKGYQNLQDEEKTMVRDQVKMKIKYNTLDAVAPEEDDDIKINFNDLKSCVITALMYAEGGTVLGTNSVKGLHYILINQFPNWAQYSDDDVHAQIYQAFGYQSTTFDSTHRDTAVTNADKDRGMTASTGDVGHMVGFKKDGQSYKFKDNDHGEAGIGSHATKNDNVDKIWWK